MDKYVKIRTVKAGFKNALSGLYWLILITVITGVLTLELVNTSLEQTTDAITEQYNKVIKQAKDVSAAAVLIYALYSLIIAALIFGPKLNELLN